MALWIHPKRLFRFSIGTLLFAMLCVSGYFGGFRSGYSAGARQQFRDTISVVTYDIEFLHRVDFSHAGRMKTTDELIDLLKSCYPGRWSEPYVLDEFEVSNDFNKLEVTNYGHIHDSIESLMTQLREMGR